MLGSHIRIEEITDGVMNQSLIMKEHLHPTIKWNSKINFTLSFRKFLDTVKAGLVKDSARTKFEEHWLQELEGYHDGLSDASSRNLSSYQPLFEFTQYFLFAPFQAVDSLWGLVQPVSPYCIYSTPALSKLLDQHLQIRLKPGLYVDGRQNDHLIWGVLFYSFILQNLYGFSIERSVALVARHHDVETGLIKYFRLELDTRYMEVTVEGQLPHLTIEEISAHDAKGTLFDYLLQTLPLNIFHMKGFASVMGKEDTTHYVLEEIRSAIMHQTTDAIVETTKRVLDMLKSIVQNNTIQFGLLPFLQLNGKLVSFDLFRHLSILLNAAYEQGVSKDEIMAYLEQFHNDPRMIIVNKASSAESTFLKGIFERGDLQTVALLPIYHQSHLVGILEVIANSDNLSKQIFALEQAVPWLAELVHRDNTEFYNHINQIVQAKFTSIHPSVQWKINEAAFMYLKDQISHPQQAAMGPIVFEQVYPLYGAVDIRNSTAVRNKATRGDLTIQLTSLIATLQAINNELDLKIMDAKLDTCHKWLHVLKESCSTDIETSIYSFLDSEVNPILSFYWQHFPQVSERIRRYYDAINSLTGSAGKNRRAMERSVHFINNTINNHIEALESRLQRIYPCYFESFRTDGVEYDIYLGQSIIPDKPFDQLYLSEYRLLQLISMAEIARHTHS